MKLDANVWIAFNAQTYKSFNLARCGDTGGIWQANALHTCLDDGIKDRQQINQVAAKCVLGGEAYVTPMASSKRAIVSRCSKLKKAPANCSPSRSVESSMASELMASLLLLLLYGHEPLQSPA